jgi:hypothetical protein
VRWTFFGLVLTEQSPPIGPIPKSTAGHGIQLPITSAHAANSNADVAVVTRHNGYITPKVIMGRSVFAAARNGDPTDLQAVYDLSVYSNGGKFINVACVEVPEGISDVPFTGPAIIMLGSGRYRESDVYLACAPLASVAQQNAWHFFTRIDSGGNPQWAPDQRAFIALFDARLAGSRPNSPPKPTVH